jgi:L-amino acid N-acyltransferase YncA
VLETQIRLATPADGSALAAIYAPSVIGSVTSFELDAPDSDEMGRRIARITTRTPWLVCEVRGEPVGYAYAGSYRERPAYQWSVEVSAYVRDEFQRQGIGRSLYSSLIAVLILQGFRNAYAGITLPNAASVRLHEALGFTTVGVYRRVGYKLGAWHDVMWLARTLAPHDASPPMPVSLPELLDLPILSATLASGLPPLHLDVRHAK